MALTPYFEDQKVNLQRLCVGCDKCNQRSPLFQVLNDEELHLINKDRYSVRFNEGEVILKQGTQANYFISIIEGFSKMYIEGFHDRNLILEFIKSWKLIGSPGVHLNGKYRYTVIAIKETLVCFIDAGNFREVLRMNGRFSDLFIQMCSYNYSRSLERMVGLSQKQMHGRIADALIYLSEEIYGNHLIGAEISRQDIADYTSMSKDSSIRILKEFERDGIINLEGRNIEILESKRLHDISLKG
jgi:CRP/FNR family transcriptional regulator, polysaccharide utilization system transcription regulator